MERRLFNLLAGLSLLLFVTVGGLWAANCHYAVGCRSPFARNTRIFFSGESGFALLTSDPNISVLSGTSNRKAIHRHNFLIVSTAKYISPIDSVRLGHPPGTVIGSILVIHSWFLTLVFGLLPFFWLRRFRRERRTAQCARFGLCHNCGYDLRAMVNRCPECGEFPKLA